MAPRSQIVLRDAKQTFTTGSRVAGEVVLRLEKPTQFKEIEVRLSGESYSKVHRSVYMFFAWTEKDEEMTEPFFQTTYMINMNNQTLGPGEHRYPFEMIFPGATVGAAGVEKWPQMAPFETRPVHPLPPTFSCQWVAPAYRYNAHCAYKVSAVVSKTSEKIFQLGFNPEALPLTYNPPRPVEYPDPGMVLERRPYQISGDPNGAFEVHLHVPRVACVGSPLPMAIGASYLSPGSPSSNQPITLTALNIKMKADRHLRTYTFKREPLTTYSPLLEWRNLQVPLQQAPTPLSTLGQGAAIPVSTVPNFTTFNVAVPSYKMAIDYSVQRGNKTFKGSVEIGQLVVISGLYIPAAR